MSLKGFLNGLLRWLQWGKQNELFDDNRRRPTPETPERLHDVRDELD